MNTDNTKLRDKRLADEAVEKPATRPNQRDTKYSQRFTPDAATPDKTDAPASAVPEVQTADKPTTKTNQHNTKYSQRFTPEAAKADTGTVPAPSTPETDRRNNSKLKFTPDEKGDIKAGKDKAKVQKKRTKLQHDADTVSEKLEKARNKSGKTGSINQRQSGGKFGQQIRLAGAAAVHRKIGEAEHENTGLQSAHSIEYAGERVVGAGRNAGRSAYRFVRESPVRKTAKLESRSMKANMKLDLHKAANDPKFKSNAISRYMQKRRIKKQYAKAARKAKKGAKRAKKTADITKKTTQAVVKIVTNPKILILLLIVLLIFFIISSCSSAFSFLMGSSNHVLASTYLADETEITAAELLYTEWETDLQLRINNAETDNPGYDEYRYNIGYIGHNPFEFMAYLTAMYQDFKTADITPALQTLFNSQYQISFVGTTEVRHRTVTDPDTGAVTTEPYNWRIMTVTLTSRTLLNTVSMDEEQTAVYAMNMASYGNRQFLGNPIAFNWQNLVTDRSGYRVHPIRGDKDLHKGLDIALPIGTNIRAVHGGTVSTANDPDGYGRYIVIENSEGLRSVYGHLDAFVASDGQTVNQGDVIARSGNSGSSTGPHLHLEISKDGQYLNPIYFIEFGG